MPKLMVSTGNSKGFFVKSHHVSLLLVVLALFCLGFADLEIISTQPWAELQRFGSGLLHPNIPSWVELLHSLAATLAFALQGIALAALLGFILAIHYQRTWVRALCAFVRAIHELFWALIFIQLFGLTPLTGLLAIALPYAGTLAKIYGELLEEADKAPHKNVASGAHSQSGLSLFIYTRLPLVWRSFCTYTAYRFECAIRSSVILGFIGLPTIGFHLESALGDGHYSYAAALIYTLFVLIFLLKYCLKKRLLPLYLLAAIIYIPPTGRFSWEFFVRFFSQDIVPTPLQNGGGFSELYQWFSTLFQQQLMPGIINTVALSQIALLLTATVALCAFPLNSSLFLNKFAQRCGDSVLIISRTLPEYLLAFIALLFVGPSMLPAIFALTLHNGAIIAHLLGQFSEQLKLRNDASTGINRYVYEIVPRLYRQFLALLLYRWEVIMRETAILGMLGITTLGFYIDSAFEEFRFDRAIVLILASALINIMADTFARYLRQRLHIKESPLSKDCL